MVLDLKLVLIAGVVWGNEITWALEAENVWCIPMWHQKFRPKEQEFKNCTEEIKQFVNANHAIEVKVESAEDYDTAVSKLLNQLEFAAANELP